MGPWPIMTCTSISLIMSVSRPVCLQVMASSVCNGKNSPARTMRYHRSSDVGAQLESITEAIRSYPRRFPIVFQPSHSATTSAISFHLESHQRPVAGITRSTCGLRSPAIFASSSSAATGIDALFPTIYTGHFPFLLFYSALNQCFEIPHLCLIFVSATQPMSRRRRSSS